MIEKMSHISLGVHKDHLSHLIKNYLLKYDIEIDGQKKGEYDQVEQIANRFVAKNKRPLTKKIELNEAITHIETQHIHKQKEKEDLLKEIAQFENYKDLEIDIRMIKNLKHISYGFGQIETTKLKQLETALKKEPVLIKQNERAGTYTYIAYFVALSRAEQVKNLLNEGGLKEETLNLEPFDSTIEQAYRVLTHELASLNTQLETAAHSEELEAAYATLQKRKINNLIKKNKTVETKEFVVYAGYIPTKELDKCVRRARDDPKVIVLEDKVETQVPIKLRNHPLVTPFEFFVRSYGLPDYQGIDPTFILAVVYTLLFGMMFGDVGQGLIIILIGLCLKKPIKNIAVTIGLSSTGFGFLYGSVLGFEHVIPALWIKPSEQINYLIYISVVVGMILVSGSILINILTGIAKKDYKRIFFGPNSVTGLLFYGGVIGFLFTDNILFMAGSLPFIWVLLNEIVKTPKNSLSLLVETFENLLAYGTNTLSFIRIGALVLSHSAMMGVVFMLTENINLAGSIIVVGLGNAFVMALEIMIVGIQVLRLNYYEMFSRYYDSGGRAFVPIRELAEVDTKEKK